MKLRYFVIHTLENLKEKLVNSTQIHLMKRLIIIENYKFGFDMF